MWVPIHHVAPTNTRRPLRLIKLNVKHPEICAQDAVSLLYFAPFLVSLFGRRDAWSVCNWRRKIPQPHLRHSCTLGQLWPVGRSRWSNENIDFSFFSRKPLRIDFIRGTVTSFSRWKKKSRDKPALLLPAEAKSNCCRVVGGRHYPVDCGWRSRALDIRRKTWKRKKRRKWDADMNMGSLPAFATFAYPQLSHLVILLMHTVGFIWPMFV